MFYILLLVFCFGLIWGSFLNAFLYRLRNKQKICWDRSKCPNCSHVLSWFDLFPILSFLLLRGKCRYCQQKISWQYPLVEFLVGLFFVFAWLFRSGGFNFEGQLDTHFILLILRDWLAIWFWLGIFIYDLKWMIIPDSLSLVASTLIIVLGIFLGVPIVELLLAGFLGFIFFALQYYFSGGAWVGGGDLRLGLLAGVLLSWPNILVALLLAYILGSFVALLLLALKKANRKTALPFGVFLAPAVIITLFFGDLILTWYFSLFLF